MQLKKLTLQEVRKILEDKGEFNGFVIGNGMSLDVIYLYPHVCQCIQWQKDKFDELYKNTLAWFKTLMRVKGLRYLVFYIQVGGSE